MLCFKTCCLFYFHLFLTQIFLQEGKDHTFCIQDHKCILSNGSGQISLVSPAKIYKVDFFKALFLFFFWYKGMSGTTKP